MAPVDVVVPVYEGFEEVRDCLESLLAARQRTEFECVVINDASPNPRIREYIEKLACAGRITLLTNEANLGFVKTDNRGMQHSSGRDIVLLNSDTVVSNDWLDRLQACAAADDHIGTVTPFSNNAEICSFPRLCRINSLPLECTAAEIDTVLAKGLAGQHIDIPTAVGFCMYIKRSCLDETGYFHADTFGLGYGEENDFCMRARGHGWRNVLAADCFVYHAGGVSFSDSKEALISRAMGILDERYPRYHAEVAAFISNDPPYALRCKGMIDLLHTNSRQKVLAITHHMGGGTEKHVRELADVTDALAITLMLRPHRDTTLRLTLGVAEGDLGLNFDCGSVETVAALLRLLQYLGVSRVHIHHLMGIGPLLTELLDGLACPYDVTLHDYFLIDGNPTLTDPNGMFQADQDLRGAGSNSAAVTGSDAELKDWQARHQRLLDGAERVFAPSQAALSIYRDCYVLPNAIVTGHADMLGVETLPVALAQESAEQRPLRVLVLGALGVEKGADLLEQVAQLSRSRSQEFSFILLGYAYRPLSEAVETSGPYQDDQLDALIAAREPDLIWFPCRWPETYSYTLSAALRVGRPLLVPDIGSFPERVQGRPLTWVQAWDSSAEEYLQCLRDIRSELAGMQPGGGSAWHLPPAEQFRYDTAYCESTAAVQKDVEFSFTDVHNYLAKTGEQRDQGRRIWLLRLLLRFKQHPLLGWLSRLIPYRVQRAIKRRLSSRPLHDIVP